MPVVIAATQRQKNKAAPSKWLAAKMAMDCMIDVGHHCTVAMIEGFGKKPFYVSWAKSYQHLFDRGRGSSAFEIEA
jgi:hypothetical protein